MVRSTAACMNLITPSQGDGVLIGLRGFQDADDLLLRAGGVARRAGLGQHSQAGKVMPMYLHSNMGISYTSARPEGSTTKRDYVLHSCAIAPFEAAVQAAAEGWFQRDHPYQL